MDLLPHQAPRWSVLHEQQVVALCNHLLADNHRWPGARVCRLLVQKVLGDASVRDHGCIAGAQFDGIEAAIGLRPLREPYLSVLEPRTLIEGLDTHWRKTFWVGS